MSKKSRRRNRKILGALAAGLGAAALMRGKGMAAADVDSGRGSGLRKTVDDVKTTIAPVLDTGSNFQTRFKGKVANNRWKGPGEISGITNKVADVAPNVITSTVPRVHSARGMGMRYKKGGRVTGAAKRGFGRALMKTGRKK
tara:strand:+ start:96 stop:521 length:426 start_codon:yes stop_codon:yes gene_type:complete